jgi:ribosomal RNA-processing protein 7
MISNFLSIAIQAACKLNKMSKIPSEIAGYIVLPISLPSTPAYPVKAIHHLYLQAHAPKYTSSPDDSRSLFLVNVPIDSTEAHFRALFNDLVGPGRFASISFESERKNTESPVKTESASKKDKDTTKKRKRGDDESSLVNNRGDLPEVWDRKIHRSGGTAIAIMADERSMKLALKAAGKANKSGKYPVWGEVVDGKVPALGSARYLNHHKLQYPDKLVLQASVDAFMAEFGRKEEEAARASKKARNVPDEDGFVTVTRGGRSGPAHKEAAEEARQKELAKEKERKESMSNFYRFQGREKKKEELAERIKGFEEDKRKVQAMRKDGKGRFMPES